jgi:peptidoglycan/xylan/chitin deacetylase (PgdA/CDA1 family)
VNPRGNRSAGGRFLRWLGGRLYLKTAMGTIGRASANRFELAPRQSGPFRVALERRRGAILHILIYHRVNDDRDPFFHALPVDVFRAQMEYLAKNFRIVSLDEFSQGGLSRKGKGYFLALTFDDGYRDNYLCAFPVLRRLGLPATIFLTTGFIDSGQLPWYDRVCLALKRTTQSRYSLRGLGGPEGDLRNLQGRLEAIEQVRRWLRNLSEESRAGGLDELFRILLVDPPLTIPDVMLSWDQIREMAKSGIRFGAHTITHPVLAKLSEKRLEEEIAGSKKVIEERLQVPVRHFAYPFGQLAEIGDPAKAAVERAGFETAATTVWGYNRSDDNPFELKRFTPFDPDTGLFAMKLDWFRLFRAHETTGQSQTPARRTAFEPRTTEADAFQSQRQAGQQ